MVFSLRTYWIFREYRRVIRKQVEVVASTENDSFHIDLRMYILWIGLADYVYV